MSAVSAVERREDTNNTIHSIRRLNPLQCHLTLQLPLITVTTKPEATFEFETAHGTLRGL
jgi:hypothetical protein